MSKKDIKVPNIGEFKDVEVIEVLIKKGQKIKRNDPLITIESDKSSVEIPSSDEGTVISLNVKIGDKVSEGDKIIEIESEKELKEIELSGAVARVEHMWEELEKEGQHGYNMEKDCARFNVTPNDLSEYADWRMGKQMKDYFDKNPEAESLWFNAEL